MNNIINNILSSNGYQQVEIDFKQEIAEINLFCSSIESLKEEFFVTVQLRKPSDIAALQLLNENSQEWFDAISSSGIVNQTFEKNCTMFICQEEDNINRQTILAIEEDLYNFKKNVIAYTSVELADLLKYLELENIQDISNDVINSIINSNRGESFLTYKANNKNQKNHYSLIIKILLKMPFLTYTPKIQELSNLDSDIENEIESVLPSNHISIFHQLLDADLDWNEDNINQNVEKIWGDLS
ncbi:MAG: hypothetical protein ACI88H_002967 [Cocleimonas sp.]|jgi:hypothetical protein